MGLREQQRKREFRSWVDDQKIRNAKRKEDRKTVLSSVKAEMQHDMIHEIEKQLKEKKATPIRTQFGGMKTPWKKSR